MAAAEEQELLGAGRADAWKPHECSPRLGKRHTPKRFQVAAKLVARQLGHATQLLGERGRQNTMGGDAHQGFICSGEDLMRLGAYLLLKLDKRLLTPTVIAQVSDIFKQHQIEQCARRWRC